MPTIDELVNRFLTWPVPADVYPDGTPGQPGRTGTNLLTAPQAKAMLEHVLREYVPPLPAGFEEEAHTQAHEQSNQSWRDWLRGARWAARRLSLPPECTPLVPGKQ